MNKTHVIKKALVLSLALFVFVSHARSFEYNSIDNADSLGSLSLRSVLDENGNLDLKLARPGSYDASSFRMIAEPNKAPKFIPEELGMVNNPDDAWTSSFQSAAPNGKIYDILKVGADLYVAGDFTSIGGASANGIAKWDGSVWSSLGDGITGGTVNTMATDGTYIYVGGNFTIAGNVLANGIAKWDGASWSTVGSGVGINDIFATVNSVTVLGTDVYVGGSFPSIDGVASTQYLAKWNGTNWSSVGEIGGTVYDLEVSGSLLYIAGQFTSIDGNAVYGRIAQWDGASWSTLGTGLAGTVFDMELGAPGEIFVGGSFSSAGGSTAYKMAKWDGASWSAFMGNTFRFDVTGIYTLSYSNGTLYMGGSGSSATMDNVHTWDGAAKSTISPSITGSTSINKIFSSAEGELVVGGEFAVGTVVNLTKHDNGSWVAVAPDGFLETGPQDDVNTIIVSSSGDVYVGGKFDMIGGVSASKVAKWDGTNWSALGSGVTSNVIKLLLDEANNRLYALFESGSPRYWNGSSWLSAGSVPGFNSVFSNYDIAQSSTHIYITKNYANGVYKYPKSGGSWEAVGTFFLSSDVASPSDPLDAPHTIIVDENDDVFVGKGEIDAGGGGLYKFNGSTWDQLFSGLTGMVYDIEIIGSRIYFGGDFTIDGAANGYANDIYDVASWDDTNSQLEKLRLGLTADGSGEVRSLTVADENLYVGGVFDMVDIAKPASNIAIWDGFNWSVEELGSGTDGLVNDMERTGTTFFISGDFGSAGGKTNHRLATYEETTPELPPAAEGGSWDYTSNIDIDPAFFTVSTVLGHNSNVYLGGNFGDILPGVDADRVAKWDGTSWSELGAGLSSSEVTKLRVDPYNSNRVYAIGDFTHVIFYHGGTTTANGFAYYDLTEITPTTDDFSKSPAALPSSQNWTDVTADANYIYLTSDTYSNDVIRYAKIGGIPWQTVGDGSLTDVTGIAVTTDSEIYVVDTHLNDKVYKLNGGSWELVLEIASGSINTIEPSPSGGFYIGGDFTINANQSVYGAYINGVAYYDGVGLLPLGKGISGGASKINSIRFAGEDVYVAGDFANAGDLSVNNVAKWNGKDWQSLGMDLDGEVFELDVVGTDVYLVGAFLNAGGMSSPYFANYTIDRKPSDITLDALTIDENLSSGTPIGNLTTTDENVGETHTYSLVEGDLAEFSISGSQLVSNAIFDFETKETYSVTIRTTDEASNTFDKSFTITINNVNEIPTDITLASEDIDENLPISTLIGTLDSADPDAGDTFTYSLVAGDGDVDNSSFSIDGLNIQSEEIFDHESQDTYAIRIRTTDAGGLFFEKQFSISINDLNDAPVASADNYTVNEDEVLTISAGTGLLQNDADDDGDALTAIKLSDPTSGTITVNVDGSFTYTPDENYHGGDSFDYKVNDGTVDGNTVTVTLTIDPVNDAPVATTENYSTNEDEELNVAAGLGLLLNDTDIEGDALTAIKISDPANGAVTINADGSFTYTPDTDFNGVDSFEYKANDGNNDSDAVTVTLTVNPVNDAPLATADSYTVNEDEVLTIAAGSGLLQNDTDADDGDPLIAIKETDPANGTVTVNADGSFSYTPNPNYHGGDSFEYKVYDGNVDGNTVTVTITVESVNDAPIATAENYTMNEDEVLTIAAGTGLLQNDTDVEGDALTSIKVSDPANGIVTVNADGSFTYMPDENYNGNDSFDYKANDGNDDSNVVTVAITIDPVNDAPVTMTDSYTVNEDEVLTVAAGAGLLLNDTDVDGDVLTAVKVSDPANGIVTVNADGSFTYTPNQHFSGGDSFDYKANDGNDDGNIVTVSLTVDPVNDAPSIDIIGTVQVIENTVLNHNVVASDLEGDEISFSLDATSIGKGMTIGVNDGIINWTPNSAQLGDHSVTVTATDDGTPNESSSETFTISVEVEGTPVVDAGINNQEATEDQVFTFAIPANAFSDPNGDVNDLDLSATLAGGEDLPSWLSFSSATNTFSGTPLNDDVGELTIAVTATDDELKSVTTNFGLVVINVNDAPSFTIRDEHIVNEDAGFQSVSNWATDIFDGDDGLQGLTFNITGNTNHGLFSTPISIDETGTLRYTPQTNVHGQATITVNLSDDGGGDDTSEDHTFTITVNSVNDAPEFTAGDDQIVDEDAGFQIVFGWTTGFSDGDNENQVLTFNTSNDNNALFSNQPEVSTVGDLNFTPAPNASGVAIVTVSLSDDGGVENGGADVSAPQTFTITVNAVNDAPSITAIGNLQVIENTTLNHSVVASDQEGNTITYSLDANSLAKGMIVGVNDGNFSWTPTSEQVGDHTVTITATDDGLPNESSSETFTITVSLEGTPLVNAGISDQTATEDQAFSFAIPADAFNDPDGNVADLVYSANQVDGSELPSWLTLNNGTFSGTPLNSDGGVDLNVAVTATDVDGKSISTTFVLSVQSVNDAPVITEISNQQVIESQTLNISVQSTDEEGNTITYSLDSPSVAKGMTLNASTGAFSWTPTTDNIGSHAVLVTATDSGTPNSSSTELFNIVVVSANISPIATADSYITTEETKLEVDVASGVLANDADSDGDNLTAVLKSTTSSGTLELNADGSFSYLPNADFVGTDSFTYVANDGTSDSEAVNVQIVVEQALSIDQSEGLNVTAYPNPFVSSFTLEAEEIPKGDIEILIRDLGGKLTYKESFKHDGGRLKRQINLEDKADGVLLVELRSTDLNILRQVIKNN